MSIGVKNRDGMAGIAKFFGFPNYSYGFERNALPVPAVVKEAACREGEVDRAFLLA